MFPRLSEGYTADEALASVLHSVRDNYLLKVAVEANIGSRIFFQGATARNKALVAAFEQRLNKKILVSKFCHLTGAIGAALIISENKPLQSGFRGISLYRENISVESEVCMLCRNNCKITKVTVQNEIVAFGFLCGRDYDTHKYIYSNKSGFDLIKEYKNIFKRESEIPAALSNITIGIPYALYLIEEQSLWHHFFNRLGIRTLSSENLKDPIKIGKNLARAEFCAPMSAFYGHVKYLAEKADYIFLPIYLDSKNKEKDTNRFYCYYTQFAPSLVSSVKGLNIRNRVIMPLIDPFNLLTKVELYRALKPILNLSYWAISSAYDDALEYYDECRTALKNIYKREKGSAQDIEIMLLGRPYSIFDSNMNKNIPENFSHMNIKAYYQDMLEINKKDTEEIEPLLKAFHWNYASKILAAALITAKTKGLYAVYITSFKCAPDSFTLEYFKKIMDVYEKPYLILELDEHGSNVGYETRIEAAVRSFKNHNHKNKTPENHKKAADLNISLNNKLSGKTLLLPSWDDTTVRLFEAVLIKSGIDARMVALTEETLRLGPKTNTGQCLPINMISQSFLDYIGKNSLDHTKTSVWMLDSILSCNITMYPYLLKSMFKSYGKGMEKVNVYPGNIALQDISIMSGIDAYFAYLFGGMLKKLVCKIRPYETEKGTTSKVLKQSEDIFYQSFMGKISREDSVIEVTDLFKKIKIKKTNRPKVAIFGDIYVRDNDMMNQHLIEFIETAGGEAITTPLSDLAKMIGNVYIKRWLNHGLIKDAITSKGILLLTGQMEKIYYKYFNRILQEPDIRYQIDFQKILELFNIKLDHTGESMDNLIKVYSLLQKYPDISVFVQTSPAFCCAGLVTEAMGSQIEESTGVPVVSITYDGTEKNHNDKIIPYIEYAKK